MSRAGEGTRVKTPGVKIKFGRAQVYRYKNRIQEPKNPFEKSVRHWGRDMRAHLYRYGPIPLELLVVTTDGVWCSCLHEGPEKEKNLFFFY